MVRLPPGRGGTSVAMNTRMPRSLRFRGHDAHLVGRGAGGAVGTAGNVVVAEPQQDRFGTDDVQRLEESRRAR